MNNYVILAIASAGLVALGILRAKLQEMTAKAIFYKEISHLWEAVSHDCWSYVGPCVDEGLAYINSVPFKERRCYVRAEVYRLLDSSHHYYLRKLGKEVDRYLAKGGKGNDKSLLLFFEQNRHWLAYDEDVCDWYGAAAFESPKGGGKHPNRARKVLLEEWGSCKKRLAEEKAAEEERHRKNKEERLQWQARQDSMNFWFDMGSLPPTLR